MSFHIGDYLKDTSHLRAAEHGAYMLLIFHYWATGGLPDDDRQLASIARMTDAEWRRAKPTIRPLFGEDWRHKRIDAELATAQAKYERRANAGQKGGNATAKAKQCSSNAPAKPQQPITDNPKEYDDGGEGGGRPSDAFTLAERLAAICGHPTAKDWPPGWCGSPHWVQKCLNEGWSPEIMLAETEAVTKRKRDGPIENYIYLEKPLARAHARHAAPLPKVETPQQETINGDARRSHQQGNGLSQIIRNLRGEDGGSEAADRPPPRLLSHG